jgi:tRNA G18 (ribose-2'-O)-methylase SpoU
MLILHRSLGLQIPDRCITRSREVELAWSERQHVSQAVVDAKAGGVLVVVAEQTTGRVRLEEFAPAFPVTLVLGGERGGISPEVIEAADAAVAIPMLGMATRST